MKINEIKHFKFLQGDTLKNVGGWGNSGVDFNYNCFIAFDKNNKITKKKIVAKIIKSMVVL